MKFQKGHKKVGGRKPGSLNKRTQDLLDACDEMGLDPFRAIAKIAANEEHPRQLDALNSVLKKIMPDLKAIEHSGVDGEPLNQPVVIVYEAEWGTALPNEEKKKV